MSRSLAVVVVAVLVSWVHEASSQAVSCPRRCRSCTGTVADCKERSLTAPPRSYPGDIQILNLESNFIRILGSRSFNSLPSLQMLKMKSNRITQVRNDAFGSFPSLINLDLSDNRIHRIYRRGLRNLGNLQILTLSTNRIRSIQRVFENLPRLYQLNLSQNRIQALGEDDLSGLTRLNYLDLRSNSITTIHPRTFSELRYLRYLYLNSNPLTAFSNMQFAAGMLHLADLSHCQLTQVPNPMPASLTDLRLGNNQIAQINHTDLINIQELQLLALNDNNLQFIADNAMAHLDDLQEVWLRGNRLVYIPRGLPDSVKRLHMDQNSLENIEAGVFSDDSQLEFITLEGNQISSLAPDTFSDLSFLTTINLQGNQLRHLQTGTFRHLGSLRSLLLSSNPLARISRRAFQNLANLTQLFISRVEEETMDLEENFLPEMPQINLLNLMSSPGLAQALANTINASDNTLVLQHLNQMDLSYNTLTWLSPKFRRAFPAILSLTVEGNPFRCSRALRWLRDWMAQRGGEVAFYTYEEPMCETPYRLQGRPLTSLATNEWAAEDESDGVRRIPEPQPQNARTLIGPNKRSLERKKSDKTRIGPKRNPDRQRKKGRRSRDKKKRKGKKRNKKNKTQGTGPSGNRKGGKDNKKDNDGEMKNRKKKGQGEDSTITRKEGKDEDSDGKKNSKKGRMDADVKEDRKPDKAEESVSQK